MLAVGLVLVPNLEVMYLYLWVHRMNSWKRAVNHILAYQEPGAVRVHCSPGTIRINHDARQVAERDV
jgi:hypothetical protein